MTQIDSTERSGEFIVKGLELYPEIKLMISWKRKLQFLLSVWNKDFIIFPLEMTISGSHIKPLVQIKTTDREGC